MYSFPSRSQRRQPFAFFIAIGYGSKYFTPAVTPPGRERRALSAYAREAFVRAPRSSRGGPFVMCGSSDDGRYSLRGARAASKGLTLTSVVPWASRGERGSPAGRSRIREIVRDRRHALGFGSPERGTGPCPRRRFVARQDGPRDRMWDRHERDRIDAPRVSSDSGRSR